MTAPLVADATAAPGDADRRRRTAGRQPGNRLRPTLAIPPDACQEASSTQTMTRTTDLNADIGEVLLTEDADPGQGRRARRASPPTTPAALTLVSVLKGSLPFMADLMRAIPIPVPIDLMEVSSYGGTATESSGLVRILKDLSAEHRRTRTC